MDIEKIKAGIALLPEIKKCLAGMKNEPLGPQTAIVGGARLETIIAALEAAKTLEAELENAEAKALSIRDEYALYRVKEGVVVPREPTLEMIIAGFNASPAKQGQRDTINEAMIRIWKAMLAVAPRHNEGKQPLTC